MNKTIVRRRIRVCLFGTMMAVFVTGCASTSPKHEGPSPAASPVLQENLPVPPQPLPENLPSALQRENEPATPKTEPAPLKPLPPQPAQRPPVEVERQPKTEIYLHTVKWAGETLSIIASWYTGEGRNWKALVNANPSLVPTRIREGDKIGIPGGLLKTRQPMTKEFVAKFYSKNKSEAATPKARTGGQSEEPQLFGPKVSPRK